jgi:cytidylate kinase
MYRALTYKALQENVDLKDEEKVADVLSTIIIELQPSEDGQIVLVNKDNVTKIIRSNEVTNNVSIVAMHPKVRNEMLKRQRLLAKQVAL